jgi:hypothetical protein
MKHTNWSIYMILVVFFYSCSSQFVKKSVFVPLMKDKGETKIEGSYGYEGVNLNAAHAFSKHFGVMANGFSAFDNSTTYKSKYNYQLEGGLGFFTSFQDSFIYETFIGASRGWLHSTYTRNSGEMSNYYEQGIFNPTPPSLVFLHIPSGHDYTAIGYGDYFTAFMQHSFGMSPTFTNWNSFIWTIRAEYVKFDKYNETVIINNQPLKYRVDVPYKTFLQVMLTDKVGLIPNLMFTIQAGLNFDVAVTTDVFVWDKIFCYTGLQYTFQASKLKKRNHKVLFKRKHHNMFQRGY